MPVFLSNRSRWKNRGTQSETVRNSGKQRKGKIPVQEAWHGHPCHLTWAVSGRRRMKQKIIAWHGPCQALSHTVSSPHGRVKWTSELTRPSVSVDTGRVSPNPKNFLFIGLWIIGLVERFLDISIYCLKFSLYKRTFYQRKDHLGTRRTQYCQRKRIT